MAEILNVHIEVRLRVSESTSYWREPSTEKNFEVNLPIPMFSGVNLGCFIEEIIKTLEKEFPSAKEAYEAEIKAREEKEHI